MSDCAIVLTTTTCICEVIMTQSPSSINLEAVVGFLQETDIFSLLTSTELSEVTTILEFQRFAGGEVVFSEGDVGDAWYVLYEGTLSVSKHIPFKKDSKVAILSSPAVFGEMAILSSLPRSATIIARENVVVMRFARRKFERLLEEGKLGAYKLALGMGTVLSDRHRRLTDQVARLSQQIEDMESIREEDENTDLFDRADMFTIE